MTQKKQNNTTHSLVYLILETKMKIKIEVEVDTDKQQDLQIIEELIQMLRELQERFSE